MHRLSFLLAVGAFPLAGCMDAAPRYSSERSVTAKSAEAPPASPPAPAFRNFAPSEESAPGMMGGSAMMGVAMSGEAPAGEDKTSPSPPTATPPPGAAGISRKVIYDATLDLMVENVESAVQRVGTLVEESGGYIAEQNMVGSPGSKRSQFWKIRVPIERFESFVASVTALGELEQFNRKSQDVTAEYYDVDARIKNKKVEEQTLQKILEERSGELEDVLKVEVQLSRVRGEIEQLQGRLRVLENLSALATLTLSIRERETYEPPAPVVADFPTQIARVWGDSVRNLADFGKALTLFVVGQVVWLPFWILGLLLAWLLARRFSAAARRLYAAARTPIRISVGNPPPSAGAGEGGANP